MGQLFSACGFGDHRGISRTNLDRYTDKIENVLNDVNGRRKFTSFMVTTNMNDGMKCLRLWEECDKVTNSPALTLHSTDKQIYAEFLCEFDNLIEHAEKVDELDSAIMDKLTITRAMEDKQEFITTIKLLKIEIAKAMRTEYKLFRKHVVPK